MGKRKHKSRDPSDIRKKIRRLQRQLQESEELSSASSDLSGRYDSYKGNKNVS